MHIVKWYTLKSNPGKFQFTILAANTEIMKINLFLDGNKIENSQELELLLLSFIIINA